MLLAYQIPEKELRWFKEKGILVKQCKPFHTERAKAKRPFNARISTLKFFLFTSEFKKWQNIIYLDSDIIVRAPLDALTKIKGFAAKNSQIILRL